MLDFDKPAGPLARPIQPSGLSMQHFFDSDFGKWIEAASYTLKNNPSADLEAKIDYIVEKLENGQMADGYLNSWLRGSGLLRGHWKTPLSRCDDPGGRSHH